MEIFYELDPEDLKSASKLTELDCTSPDPVPVAVPPPTRLVRVSLKPYLESVTTLALSIRYAFTQNSDKDDQKQVMRQVWRREIKVRTVAPVKVEWEIKNADSYV